MGLWVVAPVGVDLLLQEFVGDEVDGLEGNVHGQLRGIAPVEGPQALSPPNRPDAAEGRPVWRVVHLHALFHNCRWAAGHGGRAGRGQWVGLAPPGSECNGKPSHKEKQASLDTLATGQSTHTQPQLETTEGQFQAGQAPTPNLNPAPGLLSSPPGHVSRLSFPGLSNSVISFCVTVLWEDSRIKPVHFTDNLH